MSNVTLIIAIQVLAVVVVMAELLLPSMGILTILSLALFSYSYYLLYVDFPATLPYVIVLNIVTVPLMVVWGLRRLGRSALALHTELPAEMVQSYPYKVGDRGVTITALRPAGKVRLGDVVADVLSTGSFVEVGVEVHIVKIDNSGVQVKAVAALAPPDVVVSES